MQFNFKNPQVQLSLNVDCDCCNPCEGQTGGIKPAPIDPGYSTNPYDEVGRVHNHILAELLPKWQGKAFDPSAMLDDVIAVALAYTYQNAEITQAFSQERGNIREVLVSAGFLFTGNFLVDPISDDFYAWFQRVRQSGGDAEALLGTLFDFECKKRDASAVVEASKRYESSMLNAPLSRNDFHALMAGTSVLRHSLSFWSAQANDASAIPGPVKSDIMGAAAGALAAGLPGAVIGGGVRSLMRWLFS